MSTKELFDINKIVSFLEDYKSDEYELKLHEYWEKRGKINITEISSFIETSNFDLLSRYEQEIELKKKIKDWLYSSEKNDSNYENLCSWIIKIWGGIRGSNDDKKTMELVRNFLPLKSEKCKFSRIASMSKIASFTHPEECIIYDSRVIHSLNWIILSQTAGKKFFPIPEGRNKKITAFDLNVLIRLKNIDRYRPTDKKTLEKKKAISEIDKEIFIEKNKAYSILNELIKEISKRLWEGNKERVENLYYTEMLLFIIADKDIYQDITSKVSINLNSPCQK